MIDPPQHSARMGRAHRSLLGLSVGDAFGEQFFTTPDAVARFLELRALPPAPWPLTDDTIMAMSIVDVLSDESTIDRDRLADFFAARYHLDRARGYGGTADDILVRLGAAVPWREAASNVFGGAGSMGNGAAMRAAPVGAYFCDDLGKVAAEACASAEVTHSHREGQAGAIAVAIAAAYISAGGDRPGTMFDAVLAHTPDGETRAVVEKAARLPLASDVRTAVNALGNGTRVISQDTVPFALWCAARHLGNYEEALWTTVSGLGDRDTTCAIVGGIIALGPSAHVPEEWIAAREPLEQFGRHRLPRRFREPHERG